MWGFTRPQQSAMLVLLSTFGIGASIWFYRANQPLPEVDPAAAAKLDEFIRAAQNDSTQVFSPAIEASRNIKTSTRLDLNAANANELARLPGIGAVMAQRIVDYRETHGRFKSIEELRKVKGIGAKKFAKLAPLLAAQ